MSETKQIIEQTSKFFDTAIRLKNDEEFERAYFKDALEVYLRFTNEIQSGVINIHGTPGTGRTQVAIKILHTLVQRGFEINVTMDNQSGFRQISKNNVLLVMPGTIETIGKDFSHENVEPYQNYATKRGGIVLIVSREPIPNKYIKFSFKTVNETYDNNDNLIIRSIMSHSGRMLGSIFFPEVPKDFGSKIDKIINDAKSEFLKDEVQKIIDNIDEHTKEMLKVILVSKAVVFLNSDKLRKRQNAIEAEFNTALGPPGSGKTTLSEMIMYLDVMMHGIDHVFANSHKKDLAILLHRGFSSKLKHYIQWLKVEDATYALQDDKAVFHLWINIRHLMNQATGGTEKDNSTGIQLGRVKTWLNLHEFEGDACPKAFRQKVTNLWITGIPTNQHDKNLVKNFLEKTVYYDFLEYTWKKFNEAKKKYSETEKEEDKKEIEYWRGFGVVRTAEGLFPFRMHTDDYTPKHFDIIDVHSNWKETLEDVTNHLIDLFSEHNIYDATGPMMNDAINRYELEEYGRIRPSTYQGVNYRKATIDGVKAHFDWVKKSKSTVDDNDNNYTSVEPVKSSYVYKYHTLEEIEVKEDWEFLNDMIRYIPKSRKGKNDYQGIDRFKRDLCALKAYLLNSQHATATEEGVSQPSVKKWLKKYQTNRQGYDAERVLLKTLGAGWDSAGSNSAGADLFHKKDKKLISLKFTGISEYRNYLKKVGKKELEMIKGGYDGELWIYIAPKKEWRKYKIFPKDDTEKENE